MTTAFPVIDPVATGQNILRLRKSRGFSVRELQDWFGFEEPQAIYKWQKGKSLPTVDNLYALSALLNVPMQDILVPCTPQLNKNNGAVSNESCPPFSVLNSCLSSCHPRCHCEPVTDVTGVAIRKVSIWNGFPRQCVHWLGMTRRIVLNDKQEFETVWRSQQKRRCLDDNA